MTSLTLGIRLIPTEFQRIKVENIDLESKVEILREEAAKKVNIQKQGLGK